MVTKTTNWQVRVYPKLAALIMKKAKQENRSIHGTIVLILEYYFKLKTERQIQVNVTKDDTLEVNQE